MDSLVRRMYNRLIRPYTPRKIAVFNGVPVRAVRLFDATDEFPEYERPLIAAIRSRVREGDQVVIVGGGRGVSSVAAAHKTGEVGRVTTYEGSSARVDMARETAGLSNTDDVISIRHAIVGEAIELADDPKSADALSPRDLPGCDVLVLDCEGAEVEILRDLDHRPPVLIVETHEFLEAPEEETRDLLERRGYDVVDRGVENEELGVFVLTALR